MTQAIQPPVTLGLHLDTALRPYRYVVPLVTSVLFSGLICILAFTLFAQSDLQLLKAIDSEISTLVESQDRPELLRLIKSIADERQSHLLVVQKGIVFASTRSKAEMDEPFRDPLKISVGFQIDITDWALISTLPIRRHNGPKDLNTSVLMISPLRPIFTFSGLIALFILIGGIQFGRIYSKNMKRTVSLALQPVADLDQAIRSLQNFRDPGKPKPTGILELDSIRTAILETHDALTHAQEELTQAKAKEMTGYAYQLLIHDLHNPVASLGNLIKLLNAEKYGESRRDEALQLIPQIAEQILLQVTAAKRNLDLDKAQLELKDIRSVIHDSASVAKYSSESFQKISLQHTVPEHPIVTSHDPKLIRRAVSNLINNALSACKNEVKVILEEGPSGKVQIKVMDDGPGLSQAEAGLFLQGRKKSTKENRQAFGLTAVNHIARLHGGKVIYRPSDLGGACFEIQI